MAISKVEKSYFNNIKKAAEYGDLSLIETKIKATGERCLLLAAIQNNGKNYVITPFCHMVLPEDNPYEYYENIFSQE